jgi:hypothetical protein
MAKREKDIHIESFGFGPDYAVYADFPVWKLDNIEGIVSVSDSFKRSDGFYLITLDKRYNKKEIFKEIEDLAKQERGAKQ